MRHRLGLVITAVIATLLSTLIPQAKAFSGYASAPLSITATAIAGGVRVGWSSPTDVDTGITGYKVEYSTSGTSGTWTLAATVSSSTTSYDVVGLSQVDTYVRVAATTAAGTGTYGYPWTKLYGTTSLNRDASGYVTYQSGYGLGASDPFTTINSASFSRIRYRMDATINGNTYYAETDAYKWPTGTNTNSRGGFNPSVSSLMIPSKNSPYQYVVQANVSDLNVYSNNSAVTKGSSLDGRLEIWPWNYATSVNGLSPAGNGSVYDYDDTWDSGGYYGSFQVHDMTNSKPVFVWNNSSPGTTAEVAYGKNTGTHPDWTFCSGGGASGSCPSPTVFILQIFINKPVTPLIANSTTTISVPGTANKGVVVSISASSNLNGYYLFTSNGKRIAGCIAKATTGSGPFTATCSWKPTVRGNQTVVATFSNSAAGYISSQASANIFIGKRATTR